MEKPVVVFALLDWGLGHTTRTLPIIRHLMELNYIPIVACNPHQKALLREELPAIEFIHLDGYNLKYSSLGSYTRLMIIFQIPKILIKIKQENRWLRHFMRKRKIDLVISDNRFGFYSSNIPSVFITHQLGIRTGMGSIANRLIRSFNYRYINRFSSCWVPDFKTEPNLAGKLSHPLHVPEKPVTYLGCLSRLESCLHQTAKKEFILIILSGPEPQRTLLERKIIADAAQVSQDIVLVRGLPGNSHQLNTASHITVFNHLPAAILNDYLCTASYVIGRSGYTSIMDYIKTGVQSILIPTPGQAEQEYLAGYLHHQQLAFTIEQNKFSLNGAIQQARIFDYKKINWNMDGYKQVINEFINSITR